MPFNHQQTWAGMTTLATAGAVVACIKTENTPASWKQIIQPIKDHFDTSLTTMRGGTESMLDLAQRLTDPETKITIQEHTIPLIKALDPESLVNMVELTEELREKENLRRILPFAGATIYMGITALLADTKAKKHEPVQFSTIMSTLGRLMQSGKEKQ